VTSAELKLPRITLLSRGRREERSGTKMGACVSGGLSEDEKAAKKRNNEIDYELQQDRKRLRQEVKLLLLGTCNSPLTFQLHYCHDHPALLRSIVSF
jgi:hypothetical protein